MWIGINGGMVDRYRAMSDAERSAEFLRLIDEAEAAEKDPVIQAKIERARDKFAFNADFDIDDDAVVSEGDPEAGGYYVMAWAWVYTGNDDQDEEDESNGQG